MGSCFHSVRQLNCVQELWEEAAQLITQPDAWGGNAGPPPRPPPQVSAAVMRGCLARSNTQAAVNVFLRVKATLGAEHSLLAALMYVHLRNWRCASEAAIRGIAVCPASSLQDSRSAVVTSAMQLLASIGWELRACGDLAGAQDVYNTAHRVCFSLLPPANILRHGCTWQTEHANVQCLAYVMMAFQVLA